LLLPIHTNQILFHFDHGLNLHYKGEHLVGATCMCAHDSCLPWNFSVRLVDGLMWMGWDGLHFVDGMVYIMLIPHFVWLVESEGWDGMCLAYNL
jgi:hypothetical protein